MDAAVIKRHARRRHYLSERARGAHRYQRDPEYRKILFERQRVRFKALRAEFLSEYGGRCVCCGETLEAFLTMDHSGVDGGRKYQVGTSKSGRPLLYAQRGTAEYYRLKRLGWPKDSGIRILCMNCNFAIRGGKTCPHPGGVSGVVYEVVSLPPGSEKKDWEPMPPQVGGSKVGSKKSKAWLESRRKTGWEFDERGRFKRKSV